MRNGNGQLFFDINGKGIGYRHDRNWVKKKMKKLIDLELVKFESRHDCRNGKYTSWYFYDADKNLDDLKYDF
jgi:predicted nucleic-acid-binding Zn-ribbon protein